MQKTLQLAMSLSEAGQLTQAAALCRGILQTNPAQADALHLLGMMTYGAGDAEAALVFLERAIAERPAFSEAHYHLGLMHMQLGRPEQAALHYRKAIALAPDFLEAHANLGVVLNRQNAPLQALACFVHALSIRDVVEARIGAAECLQRLPHDQLSEDLRPLLTRAIAQAWRRPEELAPAAIALILTEPGLRASIAQEDGPFDVLAMDAWRDDALLLSVLESATVCEVTLERGLTRLRAALLAKVAANALDAAWLDLCSALSRQCFINEYAWIFGPAESALVERLLAQVNAALGAGGLPRADALLLLACYQPLHTLAGADALLAGDWPEAVRAVLRQQIEEPRQEEALRAELPRLTDIDDSMSCQVREQYEANPYPRWVRSSLFAAPLSLDDRVRLQVPHARFRPQRSRETLDILVAGCGTGRHSTETAHLYRGARVLAIDLSACSLAYALRKSQAPGHHRKVDYAQADILQLATLERRFDLIESVGVLHHLADPEAGWRALLPLLRPDGLMLIGLYSELARAPVVAARQFIAERGFPATAQGIRDCRAALMGCGCPEALKSLTAFGDFFGLSACRDLLFHEQEHRTNLPAIRAQLDRLGLNFVGLHVEPSLLKRFQARFPQADAVHDLDLWHQYETEHPKSFVGMYQFWVQKRCA